MIISLLKAELGFTYKEIMYDISVVNLMAMMRAIPPYRGIEDKEEIDYKASSKKQDKPRRIDPSKIKWVSWSEINK